MSVERVAVAVLGAGNGGLALAGSLAIRGYAVRLWNRTPARLDAVAANGIVELWGAEVGFGQLSLCTTDLAEALEGASLVMVATTADAHEELAAQAAGLLVEGQALLLNPGRTGGAVAFRRVLNALCPSLDIVVAEAQSLVYACRASGPRVHVIGVKSTVPVAAFPGHHTARAIELFRPLFKCFTPADSVLHTGFENIGAIFHPAIVVCNAAAIERGHRFFFYQDMTPGVATLLACVDAERVAAGRAYGLALHTIDEWIVRAYPDTPGATLCERFRNNPAYHEIEAPTTLQSRLLLEDVPTGLVPLWSLGNAVGVPMPLTEALISLCGVLTGQDLWARGRTVESLGLTGLTREEVVSYLQTGKRPA